MNTLNNLNDQREEFSKKKFFATPISGLIIWFIIGMSALFLPVKQVVWILFIGTGSIVYLALFLSKFTGENFLDRTQQKNEFDTLFLYTVFQAVLAYAIAIPFFLVDYTSLPLAVGVLTGTMWIPFSWIIKHWVGVFHALTRIATILVLWYVFPAHRFVVIPFAIVVIYIITLVILHKRYRLVNGLK